MVKAMVGVMGLLRGAWSEAWSLCLSLVKTMAGVMGLLLATWCKTWLLCLPMHDSMSGFMTLLLDTCCIVWWGTWSCRFAILDLIPGVAATLVVIETIRTDIDFGTIDHFLVTCSVAC